MKNTILLLNGLWLLGLVACQPKSSSLSECPIVNVRSALQEETPISMKEDVVSIQYIPLETTDSCLISNLLNLQVTTDYMFMYNGKTEEVLQFDRKGKFIRRVGRQGNGPGEYSMISELAVDDSNKELFVFTKVDINFDYKSIEYNFNIEKNFDNRTFYIVSSTFDETNRTVKISEKTKLDIFRN